MSMRTEEIIRQHLAAAASPLPDQTPAIQCAVMLHGCPSTISGALSETPDGGLRLLSPNGTPRRLPGTRTSVYPVVEQFFDYADVMVFAVQREVTVEDPMGAGLLVSPS